MSRAGVGGGTGIAPETIMAVGDNWNDLSMLEIAGTPVLMGNAPEDLLRAAAGKGWRIAPPHDVDGVAEAIATCCGVQFDEPELLTVAGPIVSKGWAVQGSISQDRDTGHPIC